MNEKEYKIVKELRADLFYQIESKFGAEKASKYPSIIKADEAIKNYDLLHSVTVSLPTNKQIESRIKRHLKTVGHVDGMHHIAHDFRQGALYVTRFAKRKRQ